MVSSLLAGLNERCSFALGLSLFLLYFLKRESMEVVSNIKSMEIGNKFER